jgi:hypothetical protein
MGTLAAARAVALAETHDRAGICWCQVTVTAGGSTASGRSASPPPARSCLEAGHGGHPGEHRRRDIVDVIRCLVKEGMGWRAIPVGTTCSRPVSGARERPRKA